MSISKTAYYYTPIKHADDEEIKNYLFSLIKEHKRWGFDKMMLKIKNDKKPWNHKRVYRIYCENNLNIRVKPRKRIPAGDAKILCQPLQKNICWSMDFMSDALENGQKFRTFNVIDDYNRECLLIKPSYSLAANKITFFLDQLGALRGYPEMIRVDNGPEFRSIEFQEWAKKNRVLIHFIQPGKPSQNAFIERFNRSYREDVLDMNLFRDLIEVDDITQAWIKTYNFDRPHESLEGLAPIHFASKRELMNKNNNENKLENSTCNYTDHT